VELGLLIDLLRAAGLGALAQVDLGARRHANQSTAALGAMASTIQQAVLRRLADEGRAPDALADAGTYARPVRGPEGFSLVALDTRPTERPPMAEVLRAGVT
jgi:glucosyl-3-phosphoglycerate synthase